jgi:hypothetical protein
VRPILYNNNNNRIMTGPFFYICFVFLFSFSNLLYIVYWLFWWEYALKVGDESDESNEKYNIIKNNNLWLKYYLNTKI